MATTAQSIILDAQTALQDPLGTRWAASELVRHLNRAQRVIQVARPDTTAVRAPFALAAGVRQTIPEAAASLIDIPCNTNGTPITKVDVVQLDAVQKGWRQLAQTASVTHFMHDLRLPRQFEVYPPAIAASSVDMEYSAYPTDVSAPSGDGKAASTVSGNISLGDQWAPALMHMVLHYAYLKDAEYNGNPELAVVHIQRAEQMLGVQLQATTTVAPKS